MHDYMQYGGRCKTITSTPSLSFPTIAFDLFCFNLIFQEYLWLITTYQLQGLINISHQKIMISNQFKLTGTTEKSQINKPNEHRLEWSFYLYRSINIFSGIFCHWMLGASPFSEDRNQYCWNNQDLVSLLFMNHIRKKRTASCEYLLRSVSQTSFTIVWN